MFIIKEENYALFRETVGARMEGEIEVRYAFQAPDRAIPGGCAVPAVRRAPGAKPLGTGHALLCAEEAVAGDCFAVINADDFYGADAFEKLASFLRESGQREAKPPVFAMAGYVLEKTLTDSAAYPAAFAKRIPTAGCAGSVRERRSTAFRAERWCTRKTGKPLPPILPVLFP